MVSLLSTRDCSSKLRLLGNSDSSSQGANIYYLLLPETGIYMPASRLCLRRCQRPTVLVCHRTSSPCVLVPPVTPPADSLFCLCLLHMGVQVLPQLSYLCLGGLCITDAEAFALAKGAITALRDLELHNSQMLTPHGVAELTELRQLTRLKIDGIGACRCVCAFFTNTSEVSCGPWTVGSGGAWSNF